MLPASELALIALWRVKRPAYRASFALLCWAGVIGLGLQGDVFRPGDTPAETAFWRSNFWGGIGLSGLMLYSSPWPPGRGSRSVCAGVSCIGRPTTWLP
ncbi:MAG: hypothetical protein WBN89_00715 [Prochlorococcaceae cyanobacterium]